MTSNKYKEYMSSADAASQLGLSVGSIQKMVDDGKLNAVRTQGGHRRIYIDSVNEYRAAYGYSVPPQAAVMVCIMHQGKDLDPMLMQAYDSNTLQILSHPLDLLGLEKVIDVLFIDANNLWLKTTPVEVIKGLSNNFKVFIYNSNSLPFNSPLREKNVLQLIPNEINYHFISGYLAGQIMSKIIQ